MSVMALRLYISYPRLDAHSFVYALYEWEYFYPFAVG